VQLVVGRIGRAHGIGGEVSVDVRTDSPELRFAIGASLDTDPPERGPLTVTRARWHSGRLLVAFEQVGDRSAAEALRGTLIVADSSTSPPPAEDEYWDHELAGLQAVTVAGQRARRYDIDYERDGKKLVERLAFVLRGKTEYLLLCRYERGGDTAACDRLLATFTLD
jgi:hypothetical protein